MRVWTAIRVFFAVLLSREAAARSEAVLRGVEASKAGVEEPSRPVEETRTRRTKPPGRSEAITLLATLQREARFVDIVKEPLAGYTDAQIGAAARNVLRECGNVLDRLFALEPLVAQQEGSELEAPAGFDPGRFRLTGSVQGAPPFRGRLVHHGWVATRCELPQWSGSSESARVIAPVQIEVK
jgi:hypothetical protein